MNTKAVFFGLCAFATWTLTSFLCHKLGKVFIRIGISQWNDNNASGILPVILTTSQSLMCFLLTDIQLKREIRTTVILTHIFATLATNASMAFVHASSTFAIKLMEPITSAIAQRLVLSTPMAKTTLVSLPMIVFGAVAFVGNPFHGSSSVIGIFLAVLSNILLATRNVFFKLGQMDNIQLSPRSWQQILITVIGAFGVIICVDRLDGGIYDHSYRSEMAFVMVLSSLGHVTYSYVSMNVVLNYLSVVSHAIANICKRVLVVILLYAFGKRHATASNFASLVVAAAGLALFAWGKLNTGPTDDNDHVPSIITGIRRKRILVLVALFGTVTVAIYGANPMLVSLKQFETNQLGLSGWNLRSTVPGNSFESLHDPFPQDMQQFLSWRLCQHPNDTDRLSPQLKTRLSVIEEAERIHLNVFSDLFKGFKHAILFDLADYENKGDPAIATGQIYLLRKLNISLLFYCSTLKCSQRHINYAKDLSDKYTVKELIILLQGGGNVFSYPLNDALREKVLSQFSAFKVVMFPQSIWVRYRRSQLAHYQGVYNAHKNLTITVRDRLSLANARKYFTTPQIILLPDMAFHIGPVNRFVSPMFDILWLRRNDGESIRYTLPSFPSNMSIHVDDWWGWRSNRGATSMEAAFQITTSGLLFLQRGRVVITDRLHGHILSVLLGIPNVIIDNNYKKISSYRNSWTIGLEFVDIASSAKEALQKAINLFSKYEHSLPKVVPYMDVKEKP